MSIIDRIASIFGADEEQRAQLEEVAREEGIEVDVDNAPPADPPQPVASNGDANVTSQLRQLQKQNEELRSTVEQQGTRINAQDERLRAEQAERIVDDLVSGRHMPPAARVHAQTLVSAALSRGATVKMLRAAGENEQPTTEEISEVEALREFVESFGYRDRTGAGGTGQNYNGPDAVDLAGSNEDPAEINSAAEEMAAIGNSIAGIKSAE